MKKQRKRKKRQILRRRKKLHLVQNHHPQLLPQWFQKRNVLAGKSPQNILDHPHLHHQHEIKVLKVEVKAMTIEVQAMITEVKAMIGDEVKVMKDEVVSIQIGSNVTEIGKFF